LEAKKLGKSEDEVQAMQGGEDSPDKVDLAMALEDVLEELHR